MKTWKACTLVAAKYEDLKAGFLPSNILFSEQLGNCLLTMAIQKIEDLIDSYFPSWRLLVRLADVGLTPDLHMEVKVDLSAGTSSLPEP